MWVGGGGVGIDWSSGVIRICGMDVFDVWLDSNWRFPVYMGSISAYQLASVKKFLSKLFSIS